MSAGANRVVALVLVAALVLAGAGYLLLQALPDDGRPASGPVEVGPPPPVESGSDQPPRRALSRFYEQGLSWQACGDAQCAQLEVPLDYAQPRGRTIELALLRVPARGERTASLVVNPGGPLLELNRNQIEDLRRRGRPA